MKLLGRIGFVLLCAGWMPALVCSGAFADITLREQLAMEGVNAQIAASTFAVVVEVRKVQGADRKVSATCAIKRVIKNEIGVDFSHVESPGIVATFWKRTEGPVSSSSPGGGDAPIVGESLLLIFLKEDVKKTASGLEFIPSFVRDPKDLDR